MSVRDNEAYWVERHESLRHKLAAVGDISSSEDRNIELYARKKRRVVELLRTTGFLDLRDVDVLDAGCGVGMVSEVFFILGARVSGLDASPVAIEEARLRCPGGDFKSGSLLDFSFPADFELVFCLDVLYHVVDDENWSVGARVGWPSHVRPGGRLVLIDQHKGEPQSPADHVRFRTQPMYDEAMAALGLRAVSLPDLPHFLVYERSTTV